MSDTPSLDDGARAGPKHSFELPVLHEPHRADGTVDHPRAAAHFLEDEARADWHDGALWYVRANRDRAAGSLAFTESRYSTRVEANRGVLFAFRP